jgi:hypothetical protein
MPFIRLISQSYAQFGNRFTIDITTLHCHGNTTALLFARIPSAILIAAFSEEIIKGIG